MAAHGMVHTLVFSCRLTASQRMTVPPGTAATLELHTLCSVAKLLTNVSASARLSYCTQCMQLEGDCCASWHCHKHLCRTSVWQALNTLHGSMLSKSPSMLYCSSVAINIGTLCTCVASKPLAVVPVQHWPTLAWMPHMCITCQC